VTADDAGCHERPSNTAPAPEMSVQRVSGALKAKLEDGNHLCLCKSLNFLHGIHVFHSPVIKERAGARAGCTGVMLITHWKASWCECTDVCVDNRGVRFQAQHVSWRWFYMYNGEKQRGEMNGCTR